MIVLRRGYDVVHERARVALLRRADVAEPRLRSTRSAGCFERLLARQTPLSAGDHRGRSDRRRARSPHRRMAAPRIPVKETTRSSSRALAAPDRDAMMTATADHLRTATDVLRVATVRTAQPQPRRADEGARSDAACGARSLGARAAADRERRRGLQPPSRVVEAHRRARIRSSSPSSSRTPRSHSRSCATPSSARGPHCVRKPSTCRASASKTIARTRSRGRGRSRTRLAAQPALRARAADASAGRAVAARGSSRARRAGVSGRRARDRRKGDAHHGHARRAEHAARVAEYIARRGRPWQRRVYFPKGEVLRAFTTPDRRPLLRGCDRRDRRRHSPRAARPCRDATAVSACDRSRARRSARADRRADRVVREYRVAARHRARDPAGNSMRLFLHWQEPPYQRVDLDLSVGCSIIWNHVGTCDFTNLVVGGDRRAAVHSGDLTSAPPPLGASSSSTSISTGCA